MSCTKLQGVILWVILIKKYYAYVCPIINRYIVASILILQVTVRYQFL